MEKILSNPWISKWNKNSYRIKSWTKTIQLQKWTTLHKDSRWDELLMNGIQQRRRVASPTCSLHSSPGAPRRHLIGSLWDGANCGRMTQQDWWEYVQGSCLFHCLSVLSLQMNKHRRGHPTLSMCIWYTVFLCNNVCLIYPVARAGKVYSPHQTTPGGWSLLLPLRGQERNFLLCHSSAAWVM